mmetsp:Transcript_26368/g.53590  ORF Transcript_26368/g.53590 Transcript_26368/m.53590 type:complete len:218 (-) Transcript_26368:192-845(-)
MWRLPLSRTGLKGLSFCTHSQQLRVPLPCATHTVFEGQNTSFRLVLSSGLAPYSPSSMSILSATRFSRTESQYTAFICISSSVSLGLVLLSLRLIIPSSSRECSSEVPVTRVNLSPYCSHAAFIAGSFSNLTMVVALLSSLGGPPSGKVCSLSIWADSVFLSSLYTLIWAACFCNSAIFSSTSRVYIHQGGTTCSARSPNQFREVSSATLSTCGLRR